MNASSEYVPDLEQPDTSGGLAEQLEAIRRRIWPMLIAFGLILAAAIATALLWPPTYRSMGTILIEQQEVPLDFVRSAVSSYADERVQVISQRVMTMANLQEIIEKYKLYADKRNEWTREQMIGQMREDVQLKMISADVVNPRAGSTTKATIAFEVGFESRSPDQAAKVANDLVTLYLRENLETRKQLAASTTQFLAEESERLRSSVAQIEERIATFKEQHYDNLPEFAGTNQSLIGQTQAEVREVESRIQSLDQQVVMLDTQLAQIDPRMPVVTDEGKAVQSQGERLRLLREQYFAQLADYTPKHPSVAALKREIYSLELQAGGGSAALQLIEDIESTITRLAEARRKDPVDAAEVAQLESRVAQLGQQLKAMPTQARTRSTSTAPDNPAFVQLSAQKQTMLAERGSLTGRRADLQSRLNELQMRQTQLPAVERDYSALQRELQGEQTKYAEVRQKLMEAQLAQNLETEQKGERFTLIEPPVVPQEPVRPDRRALFIVGLLLAIAAAVGIMLLLEMLDTRIRGRRQIVRLVGVPPLAIIPWVGHDEDSKKSPVKRLRRRKRPPKAEPQAA